MTKTTDLAKGLGLWGKMIGSRRFNSAVIYGKMVSDILTNK